MLEIVALGGLGEFGMNMLALSWGETTIVVDAGVMFPDPELLGVDRIIPDLTYLQQKGRIAALVLTHGHEDHIGGVPHVMPLVDATVMLQREVADRLVAPPGRREYGVLSILIRHAADVDLVLKLPPGAFRPPPKVLSALVRLRFHPPDPPVADPATFAAIVQGVFTQRRKTLANALRACGDQVPRLTPADALAAAGLNGTRRPETLAIGEFARLADVYAARR